MIFFRALRSSLASKGFFLMHVREDLIDNISVLKGIEKTLFEIFIVLTHNVIATNGSDLWSMLK
jgi:hypothetical protein